MIGMQVWTIGIVTVVVVLLIGGVVMLNGLITARNRMREGWSGIEVQLKLRHDLIPNLVMTAKSYAAHEHSTLEEVIRARDAGVHAHSLPDVAIAEQGLTRRLSAFLALAEAYPDLKADTSFLQLQDELVKVEAQIQMARRYFNGTVRDYNIRVESVPSNLIANCFHFESAAFFEIDCATQRNAPQIQI